MVYGLRGVFRFMGAPLSRLLTKKAAEKTLSINEELSYGPVAMGMIKSSHDWDWSVLRLSIAKP